LKSFSQFIHKSVIDVNEEGTEAAAASGADVALFSSLPIDPIEFRVNRPFVYFIRDNRNGVIIFMGIITNLK
jgi:serpin B